MFFSHKLRRTAQILFLLTPLACILWLGVVGKLSWYIHPRYELFTITMSVIALLIMAYAFVKDLPVVISSNTAGIGGQIDRLAMIAGVLGMLVIPPAVLSNVSAQNRGVNDGAYQVVKAAAIRPSLFGGTVAQSLSVREWSAVLSQASDLHYFDGTPVELVGFVTSDPTNPDIFFVSRFIVTCCAVDARPVGVPVYQPGWTNVVALDQWVRVDGEFGVSSDRAVIMPESVTVTEVPEQPYDY